jgi:DNA-binding NarL/FixJ family response regulator
VRAFAEASNGREALEPCKKHHPDVVVIDIMMPQLNGLDAAVRLAAISPQTRTIILSMSASEEYILQALRCGAGGYLLKTIGPSSSRSRAFSRSIPVFSPLARRHLNSNNRTIRSRYADTGDSRNVSIRLLASHEVRASHESQSLELPLKGAAHRWIPSKKK